MPEYIFVSAGDVSGDIRASELICEIKKSSPKLEIISIGGEFLKKNSDRFLCNIVALNGFGFLSALRLYFKLRPVLNKDIIGLWKDKLPSKIILIDYYGFNIHIAKKAKEFKIPVYYYVSPQVWATRRGRIKKLAKYVRKMLVILPFEKELYEKEGIDCEFVGHPILDSIENGPNAIKKDIGKPLIGLFPGSRKSVISNHIKLFKDACKEIKSELDCDFKVFTIKQYEADCRKLGFDISADGNLSSRMGIDFAISVSGTVSLENALLGIPMVVIYKLSYFNYLIAKILVKIKFITMANILKDKMLVVELIQSKATPSNIKKETLKILKNKELYDSIREELISLKSALGAKGAARRASEIILKDS